MYLSWQNIQVHTVGFQVNRDIKVSYGGYMGATMCKSGWH